MKNTHGAPSRCVALAAALSLALMAGCGGGGDSTGPGPSPLVATTIAPASATALTGTVGEQVAEKPAVLVRDQNGNALSGATVVFTVVAGGGSLTQAAATTNSSGVATVGGWTLGSTAGTQTVQATIGTLQPVMFDASAQPGPPASVIPVTGSNGQCGQVGLAIPTAPAVTVRDQFGNGVPGVNVVFSVASGGGSVSGEAATTNATGTAAVGAWTLGAGLGEQTLAAAVQGTAIAPLVFSAAGIEAGPLVISGITPATIAAGATVEIAGSGFCPAPAQNTVTVAGANYVPTAATPTLLTVVIPAGLPCEPSRNVAVAVTAAGRSDEKQHPLQSAVQRTLAVGASLVLRTPAEARCNELTNTGGRYMISVYDSSSTHTATGAGFQLHGAASAVTPSPAISSVATRSRKRITARTSLAGSSLSEPVVRGSSAHTRVMEENIEFLRRNRHLLPQRGDARFNQEMVSAQNVGDLVQVKIPKAWRSGFCASFHQITARVAYVGTRSVILEDQNNPMAGQIDTTYASIGQEFDNVMFPILEQYFGNPLAMDAQLSNTGKVNMVFSKVVVDSFPGIAGYVVSCDFFSAQTNPSSNVGQYFYATSPTVSGNIQTAGTPPRWRWTMRATVLHEAKHITAFAERISRNVPFEVFWLEEALARLSEEMYERHRYGFAQRENRGWGQSTNVGPYCGVNIIAPPQCALQTDQPRGFIRAFEELAEPTTACNGCGGFYAEPHRRSPLGRLESSDFSFYSTGWALSRWMIDHSATAEATIIKNLVQSSLVGLANLEAATGRTWSDMQPEWLMAMALDDRPSFAPANSRLTFPSWNLRDIFGGLKAVFDNVYPSAWPLVQSDVTFGTFTVNSSVVPGGGVFVELSGAQSSPQLIELRAAPGVPAPGSLRVAIVRLE